MGTKHTKENHPVRWILVDEIAPVWPEAQRPLIESNVRRIVDNFDSDALGIIQVAEKNGKNLYHPLDGQHRVEALKRMGWGDQLVKAEVHPIHDAKSAAALFLALNTARKVSAMDTFRAGRTAGLSEAVEIDGIVRANGFTIQQSDSTRAIAAVGTLREIYRKFGGDVLAYTLQVVSTTWREDPNATNSTVLRGMGYVVGTYGNALDFKRMRDKVGKKYTAANLIAAAQNQRAIMGTNATHGAMSVIVHCYNQGLKDADRLPQP